MTLSMLAPSARGASQSDRGRTIGGRGRAWSGARGRLEASGERRVCYVVLGKVKAEASDVVITSIVLVSQLSTSILFDLGSIYSYVSTYITLDIDGMSEPLDVPIRVFT